MGRVHHSLSDELLSYIQSHCQLLGQIMCVCSRANFALRDLINVLFESDRNHSSASNDVTKEIFWPNIMLLDADVIGICV